MINLTKSSGLPLQLNLKTQELAFGQFLSPAKVAVRHFSELKPFLKDGELSDLPLKAPCYYMYRGVGFSEDKSIFAKLKIRYDITLILPQKFGEEYAKTAGHFHPSVPGSTLTYPEVYEVLYGKAYYLIQEKSLLDNRKSTNAFVIEAQAGDKVLIPPNFGHITINPTEKPLIMANLVCDGFESEYRFFKTHKGGAYYFVDDNGQVEAVANPLYKSLSPLKKLFPKSLAALGLSSQPLYLQFRDNPQKFQWLCSPQLFQGQLNIKSLFKQTANEI